MNELIATTANDSIQCDYNASKEEEKSLREKFLNIAGRTPDSKGYDSRMETVLKLAMIFSRFDSLRYGDFLSNEEMYALANIAVETKNTNTKEEDEERIAWWRQRINTVACAYDGKYGSLQSFSVYRITQCLGLKKGEFPSSFTALNNNKIERSSNLTATAKGVQVPFFDNIVLTDEHFDNDFALSPHASTVKILSTFALELNFNALHVACIVLRLLEKPELCTTKEVELLNLPMKKWNYLEIYKEVSKVIYAQNFGILIGRAGEAQIKSKVKQSLGARFKNSTWNEDIMHDIDFKISGNGKGEGTKCVSVKTGKTGLLAGVKKYRRNAKRLTPNYYIGLSEGFSLTEDGNIMIDDEKIKIFTVRNNDVIEIGEGLNCVVKELSR